MGTTFKAGLIQTNVSNEMAENVAFVLRQPDDAGSRWDHSVLSYFMNLLALPAPQTVPQYQPALRP